jgi:hypothetical protein
MEDIGAVGKFGTNKDQGYAFRALADVLAVVQPAMAKHRIHIAPFAIHDYLIEKGTTRSGSINFHVTMRVEFRIYAHDGSYVPVVAIGEALDTSDKASNKAMSAALKYGITQAFVIPERNRDTDTENESLEVLDPLFAALDALGLAGQERGKWCESVLGRPVPAPEDLTKVDVERLIAAAKKQAESKGQAVAEKPSAPATIPPATPASQTAVKASKEQIAALCAVMNKIGIKTRPDVLAWINTKISPSKVDSRLDLTPTEAKKCIEIAETEVNDKSKE